VVLLLALGFVVDGLVPSPWSWSRAFIYAPVAVVVVAAFALLPSLLDKGAESMRVREARRIDREIANEQSGPS